MKTAFVRLPVPRLQGAMKSAMDPEMPKPDLGGTMIGFGRIFLLPAMALCMMTISAEADTAEMANRLARIQETRKPENNNYLSTERAAIARLKLSQAPSPQARVRLLWDLANELLNSGASEEALTTFLEVEKQATLHDPDFLARNKNLLLHMQGLSHLRIGEQENCLHHHNPESCIFPLHGGGIHLMDRGAAGAFNTFSRLLNEFPEDIGSRWLLNISAMALGKYPDAVDRRWIIDPALFESPVSIGRFPEVADAAGLDQDGLCGGSVMEDFNGDGWLDLMISDWSLEAEILVFLSTGDGSFRKLTSEESGLKGITGGLNLIHADYDNDGRADVLVLRGAWRGSEGRIPNSLLRNLGNGRFEDVTIEAGLYSARPTQTATWFDYNNDGWLDVFIGNETETRRQRNPCELYRNNGDGTFTECARDHGLDHMGYIKGVTSADFNNDGRIDLYLSDINGSNVLFRNDGPRRQGGSPTGPWKFTDVSRAAGVQKPDNSFPTWFFDYDNDGWMDIFVSSYRLTLVDDVAADYLGLPNNSVKPILYHNNRDGTFTDVTKAVGLDKATLAMGCNFGDLNNDGFLDFYLGTGNPQLSTIVPNRMFLNIEGKEFADISMSGGFGHLQKGHGVSFGDIDNDGDQDVYAVMGGAVSGDNYHNILFKNPGQDQHNHWIKLTLTGKDSNRNAIGTRVSLTLKSPASPATRNIERMVTSGSSFGANPFRLEIGLGDSESVSEIRVFWPATGKTQTFENLQADKAYHISEDSSDIREVPLKSFALKESGTHQHHHNHSLPAAP